MSVAMYNPTSTSNISSSTVTFLPALQPLKIVSLLQFPSSKQKLAGEFVSQKIGFLGKRVLRPKTMSGLVTANDFGGGTGDEEVVVALEQQSFIDGSSECRPNSTAVRLESTLNRMSKWFATALFGVVLLCRHDAEALWAAIGSVLNTGLSTILKNILNQERPVSSLRSGPGMPSSHAQSFFFITIFVVLSLVQWLGANGLSITLSGFTLAFSSYMTWLRVSQQLHTISQVVVGALLGSIFSILWFWSWDAIVLKAFISYLWVQVIIVAGSAVFCLGFVIYILRYWVVGGNQTS